MELVNRKSSKNSSGRGWKCLYRCHCGNLFETMPAKINNGHTKSCGCLKRKHGLSGGNNEQHILYDTWTGQRKRTMSKTNKHYRNYGARGITFSEEFNSFVVWLEYVESLDGCYMKELTLDRIDNDGGYERGNLRWATKSEQALNRRANGLIKERFITLTPNNTYRVRVYIDKKSFSCGTYKTLDEAIEIRDMYLGQKS